MMIKRKVTPKHEELQDLVNDNGSLLSPDTVASCPECGFFEDTPKFKACPDCWEERQEVVELEIIHEDECK